MKKILIILVCIVAAAIAYVFRPVASSPTATISTATTTTTAPSAIAVYNNISEDYALIYPSSLQVKEYTPEIVSIGKIDGDTVTSVADIHVITIQPKSGETFVNEVISAIKIMCQADGPTSSYTCTGAKDIEEFTTTSGLSGYTFTMTGELKNLSTKSVTTDTKGPFFAFLSKTGAMASKVVVIHPPINISSDASDATAVKTIASSLTIKSNANSNLSAYIHSNITILSPVKAQLRGTFFVTDLDAENASGTVQYEDGHNAYTADFTYSLDQDGKVTVNSFKVRK